MACGGSSSGNTSNKFERVGTSKTLQSRTVPSFLESLIRSNISTGDIGPALSGLQNNFLQGIFSSDFRNVPGKSAIDSLITLDPDTFQGSSTLKSIASIDPYSENYLTSLDAFYQDVFEQAAAAGRTGPDAVRGGAAHGSMVEGQVLEKAALDKFREINAIQQQQAATSTDAAKSLGAIEASRRGDIAGAQSQWAQQYLTGLGTGVQAANAVDLRRQGLGGAQATAAEVLGTKDGFTEDNLAGKGLQQSSHSGWQAGLSCCFIFLEALNGQLPWYVRVARDTLCTPGRVRGYRRMSSWLVPAMQRHRSIRYIVNNTMIKPFLKWGAYLFRDESAKPRYRYWAPVCRLWFRIWDKLGEQKNG